MTIVTMLALSLLWIKLKTMPCEGAVFADILAGILTEDTDMCEWADDRDLLESGMVGEAGAGLGLS
jgi:hypothetical protein